MDYSQAIAKRHTVKRYLDKSVENDIIDRLVSKIEKYNLRCKLCYKIMINSSDAISGIWRFACKNVKNYIILSGFNDVPDTAENIGRTGAELMLFAQTMGLNTWWIGGSFSRKIYNYVEKDQKIYGVLVFGYGVNNGKPHKSKKPTDVAFYRGGSAQWFENGVRAALMAPTAANRQAFKLIAIKNVVRIEMSPSPFDELEKGIIKYFFEIGAGKENFEWES